MVFFLIPFFSPLYEVLMNYGSLLGIMINCRTTITLTGIISLSIVIIFANFRMLPIRVEPIMMTFQLTLFILLLIYGFTIKPKRNDDSFVWATPDFFDKPLNRNRRNSLKTLTSHYNAQRSSIIP